MAAKMRRALDRWSSIAALAALFDNCPQTFKLTARSHSGGIHIPMKGSVYGGILYLPQHPYADIHGLVRAVMRTKSWAYVSLALEQLSVVNPSLMLRNGIWGQSGSAVEKQVTEGHYGELLVCPLVEAYLNAEKYQRLSKDSLTRSVGSPGEVHTSVGREAYPKAYKA